MKAIPISQHGVVIGRTFFAQGRDRIQMSLLDHGGAGVDLRLSLNRIFFFEQRFDEPADAARAAFDRRREYERDGWMMLSARPEPHRHDGGS